MKGVSRTGIIKIMENKKVGILAECVCDLPKKTLRELGVDILYFLIETETGIFTDTDEITAENIISYMEAGGQKTKSSPPSPDVYIKAFEKDLKKYDEVIHVAISSQVSNSCANARKAVEMMGDDGKRIHIFDSCHLSSGLGFFVMRAAELANSGCSADMILSELESMKGRVSTTFLTQNADYLHRNGLVPKFIKNVCSWFRIHPVLCLKEDGRLSVKNIIFGNYTSACRHYVRTNLKGRSDIDKRCAFITHVGCDLSLLNVIKNEINKHCHFNELNVTSASATISSNCGPGTFGVLFITNE